MPKTNAYNPVLSVSPRWLIQIYSNPTDSATINIPTNTVTLASTSMSHDSEVLADLKLSVAIAMVT